MTGRPELQLDLAGVPFALIGGIGPLADAVAGALRANGAVRTKTAAASLLIVTHPLLPTEPHLPQSVPDTVVDAAAAMAAAGGGRIVFLLPALAALPARRFPELSQSSAAALAAMRGLAMAWAPSVLVNAVGVGTVYDADLPISGDPGFLGHVPLGRPGRLAEAVAAVLFFADPANTYTTGQLLAVDGGWMAGYGRNF